MKARKRKSRRATYRETAKLRRAVKLLERIENGGSFVMALNWSDTVATAMKAARACGGVVIVRSDGIGVARVKP